MTALTEVRVHHGAAPALGTDVTNATLRFKVNDNDVQDANDPVPIPAVGLSYSWRKSFRLVVASSPDNEVSNLRFYADAGSLGTGRRVLFARAAAYTQATVADETTPISAVDLVTKTSASPESIQPGVLCDDSDTYPLAAGVASSQDYVELQLEVDATAQAGNSGSLGLRYRYDES